MKRRQRFEVLLLRVEDVGRLRRANGGRAAPFLGEVQRNGETSIKNSMEKDFLER